MQNLHITINENHTKYFILKAFPCAECDCNIPANREESCVFVKPVTYVLQQGRCPECGASNTVLSAKTRAECLALERMAAKLEGVKSIDSKVLAPHE